MTKKFKPEKCPMCGAGDWIPRSTGVHRFKHKRHEYCVEGMHDAVCSHCQTRGFIEGQYEENARIIAEFEKKLRDFISPSDIYAIREKYLISQEQAGKIFACGKSYFSKWENGEVSPTGTAALTLKAALEDSTFMKKLADDAGVIITLPKKESSSSKTGNTNPYVTEHVIFTEYTNSEFVKLKLGKTHGQYHQVAKYRLTDIMEFDDPIPNSRIGNHKGSDIPKVNPCLAAMFRGAHR
jgi:putative zinc finger/helix-turn-helix YgiT family protein